jgi:hypothetical protein
VLMLVFGHPPGSTGVDEAARNFGSKSFLVAPMCTPEVPFGRGRVVRICVGVPQSAKNLACRPLTLKTSTPPYPEHKYPTLPHKRSCHRSSKQGSSIVVGDPE